MPIQSPEDLAKAIAFLIAKFEASGQPKAAHKLRSIQETAFTTSSEWFGELGKAIQDTPKQSDPEIKQTLAEIQHVVKRR